MSEIEDDRKRFAREEAILGEFLRKKGWYVPSIHGKLLKEEE
ncbi:MAG: hypothetical protein ACE5PM_00950 [Candidatus Hydrothermarchaeales archaeon]